jgi:hypothetical protein
MEHDAAKLNATQSGIQMRRWIGIAVVVAIGLLWSVAAMSKWVPINSTEMRSAAITHVITVRQVE